MSDKALSVRAMLRGSIKRLAHVFRYSSLPVIRRESVAEHTAFVALFSLFIAKDLRRQGIAVDMDLLLKSSLVHDIDESLSGDFLRCVKYGVPGLKGLLDQASIQFMKSIEDQVGVVLIEDWKNAKNPETIEGWIVSVADLMSVVSYLEEELSLGNRHITYILDEVDRYFGELLSRGCPESVKPYVLETCDIIASLIDRYMEDDDKSSLLPPEEAYG